MMGPAASALRTLCQALRDDALAGEELTDEEVDEIMAVADTNRDGLIAYPQWVKTLVEATEAEKFGDQGFSFSFGNFFGGKK